jgi:hypothetical protein
MSGALTQTVVWLNAAAGALGRVVLAPVAVLPGWLSATLAGAVTGVLMLVAFKYTSNQRAIKRVRDDIKAHLLSLKLFKESAAVARGAQAGLTKGAGRLFVLALVPLLVMAVPMVLILGQLSLWYQARPLPVGEDAVLTLKLNGDGAASWPDVRLEPADGVEVVVGPVRVESQRQVCWELRGKAAGTHRLVFEVGGQRVDKELAVGDGFRRVSVVRPGWDWSEALKYPWEQPFKPDAPVREITIDYPPRESKTSGTDWWVVYWFAVSFVAALCFRRALNVNL